MLKTSLTSSSGLLLKKLSSAMEAGGSELDEPAPPAAKGWTVRGVPGEPQG